MALFHETRGARCWRAIALAGASCAMLANAGYAAPPKLSPATPQLRHVDTRRWKPMMPHVPPTARGRLRRLGRPGGLTPSIPGPGLTVPYWTTQITSPLDHNTYNVSMVGSSPYAPTPTNTNVTYVPAVVRIHLGGLVLNPTVPSPSYGNPTPGKTCDAQSPSQRFFNSPIFRPTTFTSNGVPVSQIGGSQLESAFQRANFWSAVHGTQYGVTLIPSRIQPIVVDWTPTNPSDFVAGIPDNCGGLAAVAVVNINEFNDELLAIAAAYAKSNQVPVTLGVDTAIYVGGSTNNCCVLGYHNAVPVAGGTQLYAVGAYFDTNSVFGPGFADTVVWSHELSELIDDPFVQSIPTVPGGFANDLTPPWGGTGQVGGCQNNLETGDPLSPGEIGNYPAHPVVGVGGFVYHYQDLAFHDWFYRTPSSSTGGKFSFTGTFTRDPPACPPGGI
jgi:hypothetical protein